MARRLRIFTETDEIAGITASAFPVEPPEEWLEDPKLSGETPLTVTADGRVYGHIAAFSAKHIGLPGRVRPPRSRSGYKFFNTGVLRTASGKEFPVGQLTLAGGHAPMTADAAAAVKHYDDTASAIADVRAGEDRYGIWVAGALRPNATPDQIRALRASAPSGDWRPINGHLELVACCQVNVPGFPLAREAITASGEVTALVAAGAREMAELRTRDKHWDDELYDRVRTLEAMVASLQTRAIADELRAKVHGKEPVVASVVDLDAKREELRKAVHSK